MSVLNDVCVEVLKSVASIVPVNVLVLLSAIVRLVKPFGDNNLYKYL